jgi:hypothetical protein
MIKVALLCDDCGAVIADGISANEVRLQAEALYRRRKFKDLCLVCEADALAASPPTVPDYELNAEGRPPRPA